MVYQIPYSWYIEPLPMVYRTPYPWYIEAPTHGISNALSMIYRAPYPWYFEHPTHGISNPLLMVFWPLYPWYIESPTHGLSNPQSMVYQIPYPWYIEALLISWLEMGGGSKYDGGFNLPYRGFSSQSGGSTYHGWKLTVLLKSPPWRGWLLWNICVTNDHGNDPLVVNTFWSFLHSWLVNGFVTRLTRWVSLVEQELLTLPEHLR
jgi:hypothetical protein